MFQRWLARSTRLRLILAAVLFAVAVFLCDTGLDFLMLRFSSTRRELLYISDAITAVLAGGLLLWILLIQRRRRLETEERMQVISDMNHHVRNALQVISYWGMHEADRNQLEFIGEAVDRIEWALSDVLPRGVPRADLRKPPEPHITWPKRASHH